ncbi:MAG: hypothetical protein OFPI_04170 [Osedax symbiont Rs2]|nr:MAG: hypothetical protein OFPI_04170 [Osedax symbiont Rs2]
MAEYFTRPTDKLLLLAEDQRKKCLFPQFQTKLLRHFLPGELR